MINKNSIPKHWDIKTLKDVCQVVTGTTPSKKEIANYGDEIPFVKPPQILNKSLFDAPEKLSIKGSRNARLLPINSVLVTCIGNLGRTAINKTVVAFNQQINALIPSNKLIGIFLFFQAQSYTFNEQLNNLVSATTVPIVNKSKFESIQIIVPPISEQHQIVSKIEELFSELDKGKQQLETVRQQLKTYSQAVLKWAFEGRFTSSAGTGRDLSNDDQNKSQLPEGWRMGTIIELAEKSKNALKAGPFGSSLKKEFYVESGYKIYGQEQVISGNAFQGDYYVSREKFEELKSNRVKPNDVLISLVGTVGKVLILPVNCQEGIINPRLIKISLDKDIYLPKFFKYYFESSKVKSFYGKKAQGTTMDVLNLSIIKTIPFPICSVEEQNLIIDEIESRLSVCDKIEETIETSLKQAESLRQSILKQAFEGKWPVATGQ